MDLDIALLLYSEWLDVQGFMKEPKGGDSLSHEDLVTWFREQTKS